MPPPSASPDPALLVLGVDGSPQGPGRTRTAIDAVLAGCAALGAATEVVSLADGHDAALERLEAADAVVLGSPVYRASFAGPLKDLLDHTPRGMWGETTEPLRAKAVAVVLTGASWHHYLALDDLRGVLAGFFAAHVVTPGLYVPTEGFDEHKALTAEVAALAETQGRAVVELAAALAASPALASVRPQA